MRIVFSKRHAKKAVRLYELFTFIYKLSNNLAIGMGNVVLLDMMTTMFQENVYALCKKVPPGRVTTYGEIARVLGSKAFRAVGQALRRNPYAPVVPCHRVVARDGKLGGFNGRVSGEEFLRKKDLLMNEGIAIAGDKIADFRKVFFRLQVK